VARGTIEIIFPLLEFLEDREYHTLAESVLHLQKSMKLSKKEKEDYYTSRNKDSKIVRLSATKFYIRVADAVHVVRYAKLIDDFAKGKGKFRINDNGIDFLKNDSNEMKKKTEEIFEKWQKRKFK
tara:strand:- start:50 stop:424 length:375 start_codon:yes stop_codon:yes gene_type:complete